MLLYTIERRKRVQLAPKITVTWTRPDVQRRNEKYRSSTIPILLPSGAPSFFSILSIVCYNAYNLVLPAHERWVSFWRARYFVRIYIVRRYSGVECDRTGGGRVHKTCVYHGEYRERTTRAGALHFIGASSAGIARARAFRRRTKLNAHSTSPRGEYRSRTVLQGYVVPSAATRTMSRAGESTDRARARARIFPPIGVFAGERLPPLPRWSALENYSLSTVINSLGQRKCSSEN